MSESYAERPQSIPEMRGMSMSHESRELERARTKKYSAASYAAQYGITVEDAAYLVSNCNNHGDVKRAIYKMFTNDPELKVGALRDAAGDELSEADLTGRERRTLERIVGKQGNPAKTERMKVDPETGEVLKGAV